MTILYLFYITFYIILGEIGSFVTAASNTPFYFIYLWLI
jgi:hypothetical protein